MLFAEACEKLVFSSTYGGEVLYTGGKASECAVNATRICRVNNCGSMQVNGGHPTNSNIYPRTREALRLQFSDSLKLSTNVCLR